MIIFKDVYCSDPQEFEDYEAEMIRDGVCTQCQGYGQNWDNDLDCASCGGDGIDWRQNKEMNCSSCYGSGFDLALNKNCQVCNGTGHKKQE